VELFERIRRDAREGVPIRKIARDHGVHRRTVRAAIADAVPPPRKPVVREAVAFGPYEEIVRAWLVADLDAPKKQRHTARRVWHRLLEEHSASLSESTVRPHVARIKSEVGLARREVMVPQTHPAGAEAEVDFGQFHVSVAGVVLRLWMFVMRLSHSGKAVHIAYANQAQESFLDGHVKAFAALGGIPTGMIRYDNLKPAVLKVLLGRERFENPKFVALRSHYGFESFYCRPGKEGAHEKGGVEGEIGRFRRAQLTPVPHVGSMAALNEAMAAADARDDERRIAGRAERVGAAFAREQPLLNPLPANDFDASTPLSCRVDMKARICVRQSYYSVPASYAGRRVQVRLGADAVRVFDGGTLIASHVRSLHKATEDLVLDHYLEVLTRKPGAMAGSTALALARVRGTFTPAHQQYWDAARRALGDAGGTRALIEALLLHRTLPATAVIATMDAAVATGRYNPDILAVTARAHTTDARTAAPVPLPPNITDVRLTAIRSLFRYAALRHPEHAALIQRVLAIPAKRFDKRIVEFLTAAEADALINAPDQSRWEGRRDKTMLALAIQTGLRVSELTGLNIGDITLGPEPSLTCQGKGRRQRAVPLAANIAALLHAWIRERGGTRTDPLFATRSGRRLSRDAIAQRVQTHALTAALSCPSLAGRALHPHVLRHTCAVSLLQAGVDTSVIALRLGHASPRSTTAYIHADISIKEKALAQTAPLHAKPGRYKPTDKVLAFLESL